LGLLELSLLQNKNCFGIGGVSEKRAQKINFTILGAVVQSFFEDEAVEPDDFRFSRKGGFPLLLLLLNQFLQLRLAELDLLVKKTLGLADQLGTFEGFFKFRDGGGKPSFLERLSDGENIQIVACLIENCRNIGFVRLHMLLGLLFLDFFPLRRRHEITFRARVHALLLHLILHPVLLVRLDLLLVLCGDLSRLLLLLFFLLLSNHNQGFLLFLRLLFLVLLALFLDFSIRQVGRDDLAEDLVFGDLMVVLFQD